MSNTKKEMMDKNLVVLFDMDGVMLDTETQYDKIWKHIGDRYNVDIPNFEKVIKGTTLPNILKKYFSEQSDQEIKNIIAIIDDFELKMDFTEIPGALDFVKDLKDKGIKVGLVTSSTLTKMNAVNKVQHFDRLFDTVVTAERVKAGKPNPECFLLAAQDLGADPSQCVVFEDSFAGIEAGKAAGMTVIALSTTHPEANLKDKADMIIPNFKNWGFEKLQSVLK